VEINRKLSKVWNPVAIYILEEWIPSTIIMDFWPLAGPAVIGKDG